MTAAYQFAPPLAANFESPWPVPVATRGVYPVEDGFRWTSGRGAIGLAGPGPGRTVKVDAVLSAWRPRGAPPTQVRLTVGTASVVAPLGPAPAEVSVVADTGTSASGDVEVRLESDSFAPGGGDPRRLGVRVHEIRVSAAGGRLAPGAPPLLPLLWAVAAVELLFQIRVRTGGDLRRPQRAALLGAGLVALGLALARGITVWLLPGLVAAQVLLLLAITLVPGRVRAIAAVAKDAGQRLLLAVRALEPRRLAVLAVLGAAGTVAAYRAQPVVVIPVGGGRETAFEEGLGSFDSSDGVRFRHVVGRASLDLRDLGGGEWRTSVTAAAPNGPRPLSLLALGDAAIETPLGPEWSRHDVVARAPTGWRSGLVLTFPGARRDDIWLREVQVDRAAAWPSLRMVVLVVASGALLVIGMLAAGLSPRAAWILGATLIVLASAALAVDPVVAIPMAPRLLAIVLAGAVVSALAAAVLSRSTASPLPPAAIAAGGLGFMAWVATTTAPLYRGGHFAFHSAIAEEIWKGRFLTYYLPYPGSMLSQQAQWGNVVVPHPALYHTLVAPLAALPRTVFYAAEKVGLALLLALMVWAAAALAARVGSRGAATAAAVLMACLPPSFQLLGLGHLMTVLGCSTLTLAVAHLALHWESLGQRKAWWGAVLLMALCSLSYFAGLLFLGLIVVVASAALWRSQPLFVRALLTASAAAAAIAFALYYVNWTWPFLSQTVPRLLSGSGAHSGGDTGALPSRLAAAPHKLAYTFGAAALPVLGLGGLLLARRGVERVLLLAWAAILPVFMVLDLSFNFLLKHHYFTMVPVAVGGGVLLAWIAERGRWGRVVAAAAMAVVAVLGARVGMDAAMGRIP